MRQICMIGVFPPPTHGLAAANLAFRNFLVSRGETPVIFDLSAKVLNRACHVKLLRGIRVLNQLRKYISFIAFGKTRSGLCTYLSLSGGYGQLYEVLFILFARIARSMIVLHHHSFLYIDEPRLLTRVLIYLSGSNAQHVALCNIMAERISSAYGLPRRPLVLSNSALVPLSADVPRVRVQVRTLGFLGNIERSKGIIEYLDVIEQLQGEVHDVGGLIAGPFQHREIEKVVRARIKQLKNVQYVGAKYGAEKSKFFNSIDVLLFPTKNDAEPITVLEAMAHGVPVIAWSRGCIAEMIPPSCGTVITGDYVSNAVRHIRTWVQRSSVVTDKSRESVMKISASRLSAEEALRTLYSRMISGQ